MQSLFDPAWPPGRLYYLKSGIVRAFSDALIEALIEHAAGMPTPLTAIAFQQLHGAASRIGIADTAFPTVLTITRSTSIRRPTTGPKWTRSSVGAANALLRFTHSLTRECM
jgi:hypothetical protein